MNTSMSKFKSNAEEHSKENTSHDEQIRHLEDEIVKL